MKNWHWLLVAVIAALGLMWMMGSPGGEPSPEDKYLERFAAQQACRKELNEAIREVNRRMQYAIAYNDQRAMQVYSPMASRLAEIRRRIDTPRGLAGPYDASADLAEIRGIRAKLGR
jgi:hypothetical protein